MLGLKLIHVSKSVPQDTSKRFIGYVQMEDPQLLRVYM